MFSKPGAREDGAGAFFPSRGDFAQEGGCPTLLQERPVKTPFMLTVLIGVAFGGSVMAASPDYMVEDCKNAAQVFFQR